jgi:hypothetical protein
MLLDDIRAYLVAQGLAPADNNAAPPGTWLLFEAYMPDDTDDTMAVFPTIGLPALTLLREIEGLSFQFRVRGSRLNYLPTYNQWQACFNALQDSQPTPDYKLVQAVHYGPMFFNDDRGRPNFITNFRVIKLNND